MNYWHPVTNSCSSSPTQWPRRLPVRNIAEEKHVLHTCQINIPIAKKIINQKFISVAHLRNNYFVTNRVLLVIHDTMQYFKTNDMYLLTSLSICAWRQQPDYFRQSCHCVWGYGGLFKTLIQDMLSINIAMFILWKFSPDLNYYISYIGRC